MMKYPADFDELLHDQIEDLERDRRYVGESIDDCCRLLGGDVVLNIVSTSRFLFFSFYRAMLTSLRKCSNAFSLKINLDRGANSK